MLSFYNRFFKDTSNLTKLRNIVSTYVWTHLEEGYSQGMCDLLAPLLVILQDEALTYACFLCLMKNAILLFPPHTGMNTQLSNLKALLQVSLCVCVGGGGGGGDGGGGGMACTYVAEEITIM